MKILAILLALCILFTATLPAQGQNESPSNPYIITVRVTTPEGTPASGASITAVNQRSEETKTGTAGSDGSWTFSLAYYAQDDAIIITTSKDDFTGRATAFISIDATGTQTSMPLPHVVSVSTTRTQDTSDTALPENMFLFVLVGVIAGILVLFLLLKDKRKNDQDVENRENKRPERKRSR